MLRQMKQLGITAKFMGGDGICSAELSKLAGDGMSDGEVICAEAGGVLPGKEGPMNDFKAKFKAKYGTEVQIYAPYTYDAVMVMADAMVKAKSADPKVYLPFLAKEDYNGVTGHISFDSKGDIKNGALTLYTYKGGNKEVLAVVQ
jgi:branched-chain amino acid transport system substrate-binding protein